MRTRPLRSLRRTGRRWLGLALARALQRPTLDAVLDPRSVQRVLVCRVNRRLGNLVLLTPLLRSLHLTLPQAEITVLAGAGAPIEVLRGFPGLVSVQQLPRRPVLGPLQLGSLCRRLRARRFDLAIDPCLSSTTNRLGLALCGARFRLGFAVPDSWAPLTHSAVPGQQMAHEAVRPLQLVQAAFGPSARLAPRLDLALAPAELAEGARGLALAAGPPGPHPRIVFFCEAAAGKRLDAEWWLAWAEAVLRAKPAVRLVQVLPPGSSQTTVAGVSALSSGDPRRLAASLAAADLFVSADTGPMHLASAALVPTIGLFLCTDPVQYRPYGPRDLALVVEGKTPAEIADLALAHVGAQGSDGWGRS